MLYVQLKHPVTLATLLFLAAAGIAIRWNEYTLPRYARQVNQVAAALAEVPPRTVPAEAENAAPLYEEANRLLQAYDSEEPDKERIWNDFRAWYLQSNGPPGTATVVGRLPLPETLRYSFGTYLDKRREALALLYHAANIPTVAWTVQPTRENPHWRTWPWSREIRNTLLLDALRHMDGHNEADTLRAITALDAFIRAQEQVDPPFAPGRTMLTGWPWELILNNGIEMGLFSDTALDILDDVFSYEEDPGKQTLRRHRLETQFRALLHGPPIPAWWNTLGDTRIGSLWYELRFSSRNSMKEVLLYELLLKALPKMMPGDGQDELARTLQRVDNNMFFINSYGLAVNPYTSDRYISGMNCSIQDLIYLIRTEYYHSRMRLTLRTVIALERYRRREGGFPDGLEVLAPMYLSPDLLRMARETIAYHRTPAGWEFTRAPGLLDSSPPPVLYRYPLSTP